MLGPLKAKRYHFIDGTVKWYTFCNVTIKIHLTLSEFFSIRA